MDTLGWAGGLGGNIHCHKVLPKSLSVATPQLTITDRIEHSFIMVCVEQLMQAP